MAATIDRRTFLLSAALAAGIGKVDKAAADEGKRQQLPRQKFLWGTAGAAYQIEGGNVASDIWVAEHVKPNLFSEPSGDAADTYHRYGEDIALAASLGFNVHRLSIEWARIEPEPGQISNAAIDYYRGVLQAVRDHGMKTFVTFHHFSAPRWFSEAGGFGKHTGIEPFVRYCRLMGERLGGLIDFAATFNEPNLPSLSAWSDSSGKLGAALEASKRAAAAATGSPQWMIWVLGDWREVQPIMVDAHKRAYEAIREATAGQVPIGLTLSLNDERPAAENNNGVERKRAQSWDPWLQASGDFVGVQTYSYNLVAADADLPPPSDVEKTQIGYPFAPESLEAVLRAVAARCRKPIYVTENGVATEDDARRVAYIDGAIKGLINCLRDGIDVRGYMHWSLLDNWEWLLGYRPKFGLVSVDRTTFQRTPKPSAYHFGKIARAGLPADLP